MRRFRFISNKPLQFRILSVIVLSIIVPIVLVGGCLYYLIFSIMAEQLGIPEAIAYNLQPVIHKINAILVLALPPLFVVLMLWGLFLSHKFVGPLNRLEREIDSMVKDGDFSKRLKVRKDDDVGGIIHAVNRLLDKVHKR